jgi:predicted deacetylase
VQHRSARYVLRLDDLCPTSRWQRWNRILEIAEAHGIRPILAVVPQNEDPELALDSPDAGFWSRMRALKAQGAEIALHGYRHLSRSRGGGLVPLHRATEFAGAALEQQRGWIHAGLAILAEQGLPPRLWIAPCHGFDAYTLEALGEQGIGLLSDGFGSAPYTRLGFTWLPQQLWEPVEKQAGLWTICLHPNTATDAQIERLERFLSVHRGEFLSVDEALSQFPAAPYGVGHWLQEQAALGRIRQSRFRKRLRRGWLRIVDGRASSETH